MKQIVMAIFSSMVNLRCQIAVSHGRLETKHPLVRKMECDNYFLYVTDKLDNVNLIPMANVKSMVLETPLQTIEPVVLMKKPLMGVAPAKE